MDEELKQKNEYEAKKAAREEESKSDRVKQRTKSFFKKTVLALIALFLLYMLYKLVLLQVAVGPDESKAYEIQSREHIAVGAVHPAYNSNPPSGGWHYEQTTRRDYYTIPVPDEHLIHNLEHGDVWIAYHPRVSEEAKNELKKFLYPRVIITPRPQNDSDISLVAWGRVDSFALEEDGTIDKKRIDDFIKRYKNKGPEKIPLGAQNSFN